MEFPDRPNAGGNFLRLKDKQSVKGVFRGNPEFIYAHFKAGECVGAGCPHCAKGQKPSFKFRINFIMRDESNQYTAKIFEQSGRTYDALQALHKEYGLENTIVVVSRSGSQQHDTTYQLMPAKIHQLTPEQGVEVGAVKLLPLQAAKSRDPYEVQEMGEMPTANFDENDIPF